MTNDLIETCHIFFEISFQMCSHPDLNQYILDVLQTMRPLLEKVHHKYSNSQIFTFGSILSRALCLPYKETVTLLDYLYAIG